MSLCHILMNYDRIIYISCKGDREQHIATTMQCLISNRKIKNCNLCPKNKERILSACLTSVSFQVCFSQYLPVSPKHADVELRGMKQIYFSSTFLLPFVSYNFLWVAYFLTDTVEILYTTDNGTGYRLSLGAQQLRSVRQLSSIVAVILKTLLGWEVVSEEPQCEIPLAFPLEVTTIYIYNHIATKDSLFNAQIYLRDPCIETYKGRQVDQKGKVKREGLIQARNAAWKLGAQWGLSPKRRGIWLSRTPSSARRDWVGTPAGVSSTSCGWVQRPGQEHSKGEQLRLSGGPQFREWNKVIKPATSP